MHTVFTGTVMIKNIITDDDKKKSKKKKRKGKKSELVYSKSV